MDWKDTVISIEDLRIRYPIASRHPVIKMLNEQAEISFKAGQESGCYAEGWANGINEVVEWGDEECIEHPTCETTVLLRRECDKCWQAQKKVWGIDEKV